MVEILDVELKVEIGEDLAPKWSAVIPAFRLWGERHVVLGQGSTPSSALRSLHEQLDDITRPPTTVETVKAPPLERLPWDDGEMT